MSQRQEFSDWVRRSQESLEWHRGWSLTGELDGRLFAESLIAGLPVEEHERVLRPELVRACTTRREASQSGDTDAETFAEGRVLGICDVLLASHRSVGNQ